MAIATKRGKCDLCGGEKNVKPNNGIKVCSSCASVQSLIKKNPDAVTQEYARLTGSEIKQDDVVSSDIADRIRAALAVPPSVPVDDFPDLITELTIRSVKHAMEIDSVRKVLDVDDSHYDESLADIAKMRMKEIDRLASQAAQIRDIIGADASEPLVNAVRAKIDELKELKVDLLQREQCEYVEIDIDPSSITIGRLLADKKLRQKIDELAAVLDGYFT